MSKLTNNPNDIYDIRQTPVEIASEIKMLRDDYGKDFSFIITEGDTDAKVYKTFCKQSACDTIAAHNKENAIEVLTILNNDKFSGVIAIVDADYQRLDNDLLDMDNLFYTDTHDLETMILNSEALKKVFVHFGSEDKISKLNEDVMDIILKCGLPIGYLRWTSLKDNLNLKFEGLKFEKVINKKNLQINIKELIRLVKIQSKCAELDENKLEEYIINQMKISPNDPWEICCGHDLNNIICIALCNVLGSLNSTELDMKDKKGAKLEKILYLSYDFLYFVSTQLYKNIKLWEKESYPFKIFQDIPDIKASVLNIGNIIKNTKSENSTA